MNRPRVVTEETLDRLMRDDPAAMRSRADLRRVHIAMRSCSVLTRALQAHRRECGPREPLRILELGAGDGTLMLRVARALSPEWSQTELTLLDRQRLIEPHTIAAYHALGWRVRVCVDDALDWARSSPKTLRTSNYSDRWDLVVSSLFLHHFEARPLAELLQAIATRSDGLVACEPRRSWLSLFGSRVIGALGVNAVTRSDARLSVVAGFRESELTAQWPASRIQWILQESRAGAFSHCFRATRIEAG